MKRLKQKLYFYYMRWQVRRFTKAMKVLVRHGTVREINQAASKIREVGKRQNEKDYINLADLMDEKAEEVVLRRVFKK